MTITQEKTGELSSLVRISLSKEDYEPKVNESLKKLAKRADIHGFRKGMVPLGVVRKMYGTAVLAEELNKDLNDQIWKYLQENNIQVLGQPIPAGGQPMLDLDIYNLKDVDFTYEIGHAPQVDLSYIENGAAFDKYVITVTDEMINEEVERLRKRHASYEYPETVEEGDILSLTIEELAEDGGLKEGGVSTVSSLMMDMIKKEYQAGFLALKKLDSVEHNIWEIIDRDREGIAKNILNKAEGSDLSAIGDKFKLTLNNITRSKPAELNEAFYQKVYGGQGPASEEAMREEIRKELAAYFDGQSDAYLSNDIYRGIMDNVHLPLPDEFMKRWIKVANEKEVSDEEIERDYPRFAKQLRWDLITKKIIADYQIHTSPEEVKQRIRANTIQQLISYGLRDLGDWAEQFIDKQLSDKKVVKETEEQLETDKVLMVVKSKARLNEIAVSLEDFRAMTERANAEHHEEHSLHGHDH